MLRTERPEPSVLHRLLLALPPEAAHSAGIAALKSAQATAAGRRLLARHAPRADGRLEQSQLGMVFSNPIGLAAGFDKDGQVVAAAAALGFGWVEIGTVTPRPQQGNPRPRLFRYRKHRSLENRMGFNNAGAEALRSRLKSAWPASVPLGVNLGKNKETPNDDALTDYLVMIDMFDDRCDYFAVNVSSPNTPGLRDLQDRGFLSELASAAVDSTSRPIFVKLSPDLEVEEAIGLVGVAVEKGAAGVILTNTTADYGLLPGARGVGGLSGEVLREKSFALFDAVAAEFYGSCTLVSVGGVDSGPEVYRRLRAGASLVQLYTALVYQGPDVVRQITESLLALLHAEGHESVKDVVGVDRLPG